MISLDNVIVAEKDADTVWNFFNNVHSVAQCIPTMVNYEVLDDDTVVCDLRLKLGLIPLDSKATMSITERKDNRHLEARGETAAGHGWVEDVAGETTEDFLGEGDGEGHAEDQHVPRYVRG